MTIDEMLAEPGFYTISTPAMLEDGLYFRVEVEPDGVCHQLNPAGERDGVLSREGWSDYAMVIRKDS